LSVLGARCWFKADVQCILRRHLPSIRVQRANTSSSYLDRKGTSQCPAENPRSLRRNAKHYHEYCSHAGPLQIR
jgi:hypothetical protein